MSDTSRKIADNDIITTTDNSSGNLDSNGSHRKRRRRIKHHISGPAGELLTILKSSSHKQHPTIPNQNIHDDSNNENSMYSNGKMMTDSSSFQSMSEASNSNIPSGLPPILQQSPAWLACCISLNRYVDYPLQTSSVEENNNSSHNKSIVNMVHQCLPPCYTSIGAVLAGKHDMMVSPQLLVVYVYTVQCHTHSDWTCELRDETSISSGMSIKGWVEHRFVKDRPEGIRPGSVLLLRNCSLAIFPGENGIDVNDGNGTCSQLLNPSDDDEKQVERMLLIGDDTVVYFWVPDEADAISVEEKAKVFHERKKACARFTSEYTEITQVMSKPITSTVETSSQKQQSTITSPSKVSPLLESDETLDLTSPSKPINDAEDISNIASIKGQGAKKQCYIGDVKEKVGITDDISDNLQIKSLDDLPSKSGNNDDDNNIHQNYLSHPVMHEGHLSSSKNVSAISENTSERSTMQMKEINENKNKLHKYAKDISILAKVTPENEANREYEVIHRQRAHTHDIEERIAQQSSIKPSGGETHVKGPPCLSLSDHKILHSKSSSSSNVGFVQQSLTECMNHASNLFDMKSGKSRGSNSVEQSTFVERNELFRDSHQLTECNSSINFGESIFNSKPCPETNSIFGGMLDHDDILNEFDED